MSVRLPQHDVQLGTSNPWLEEARARLDASEREHVERLNRVALRRTDGQRRMQAAARARMAGRKFGSAR